MTAADIQRFNDAQTEYREHTTFAVAPGLEIGILLTLAVGSLAVYGIILGGWSANSKYSLLGALRSSAQIISYEIPLGMSILGLVVFYGSLNLESIIDWQTKHGWFILYQPLAFLLFMLAVFAECNRVPFDLPEAEQELVGGYHTEYSSFKFAMFFLGEYIHMITTSFLMAILFFGGWHFPGIGEIGGVFGIILKFAVLAAKVAGFIMLYMLVRWTIPRFKFDQLMGLAWKVMIPLSLLNLLCVMIDREFGLSPWLLTVASGGLFLGTAVLGTRAPSSDAARVTLAATRSLRSGARRAGNVAWWGQQSAVSRDAESSERSAGLAQTAAASRSAAQSLRVAACAVRRYGFSVGASPTRQV